MKRRGKKKWKSTLSNHARHPGEARSWRNPRFLGTRRCTAGETFPGAADEGRRRLVGRTRKNHVSNKNPRAGYYLARRYRGCRLRGLAVALRGTMKTGKKNDLSPFPRGNKGNRRGQGMRRDENPLRPAI